jgi:hypothetical protein
MVEHLEEGGARVALRGEVKPLPADYQGCKLYNRCPFAVERCMEPQQLVEMRERHAIRCWRASEIAAMLTARKPAATQHDVMESVSDSAIGPRKDKRGQPLEDRT